MQQEQKDLFNPGPLYKERFQIVQRIKQDMRTGDILYRYSDARGPLGIPFTRMVANATKSEYSHAAMLIISEGEPEVLEVNDEGTLKYRLLDWIDTCYGNNFSVYRLKDLDDEKEAKLKEQMNKFLEEDPDYDLTFSSSDKYYCTESVIEIYKRAFDLQLDPGYYIKDIVTGWRYTLLYWGCWAFQIFGTSLPFDKKLYFVGNETQGMMSSPYTRLVMKIV